MGRPVVVVSGLPRSGTSMAMAMLEAGGLEIVTDGNREADDDNPKGYFEDDRVMDLEKSEDRTWLRQARGKGIKIISFLLKTLPKENRYKIVFMLRNLDEVLASQKKMLDNRGESSESEDQALRAYYEDHLRHVKFMMGYRRYIDALMVDYRSVLDDPRREAERLNDFLGGRLDSDAMVAVVDKRLYRNRAQVAASS